MRVTAWRDGRETASVEVPTSSFLEELGLTPGDIGFAEMYLLQAYVQEGPGRGLRHLTQAFGSELEARQAFRRLRTDHQHPDEWAQVVALDARCRLARVCWFGAPGALGGPPVEDVSREDDDPARPVRVRRWGPRRR
jgi:hypothetical protein